MSQVTTPSDTGVESETTDPESQHLRQCFREGRVAVGLWLAGLVWTLVVVIGWGYVPVDQRPDQPTLVLGMPAWVAWGLFLPWLVEIAATWWFAMCVLQDDPPLADDEGALP